MEGDKKVEGVISSVSDTTKNVVNNATEAVSKATEVAKETISSYTNSTGAIYGLIVVIIIAGITSYGLYVLVSGVIFQQSRDAVNDTKIPILCNERRRIPITSFNNSGNGKRRSYSFWIYINDMTKYTGSYKHVLHVGDDANLGSASPLIFLDKTENKMIIRFSALNKDSLDKETISSLDTLTSTQYSNLIKQAIIIDYIPIQRWVHIAIVVNENSNNGTITTYVDGDMSNTVSSNENNISINNLDLDKKGDLYTGGSTSDGYGVGFSGLISRFVMFNYDLNQKDVYKEYNDGPIDGLLARLGLGSYGVRSPIYKIV
jgi:hypothetical protein